MVRLAGSDGSAGGPRWTPVGMKTKAKEIDRDRMLDRKISSCRGRGANIEYKSV